MDIIILYGFHRKFLFYILIKKFIIYNFFILFFKPLQKQLPPY